MLGRFGHQRLFAQNAQARVFAGKVERLALGVFGRILRGAALRQRGGRKTQRHVAGEGDRSADGRAHRGQTGAAEKAATAGIGNPSKNYGVSAFVIVLIQFLQRALNASGHGASSRKEKPPLAT